MKIPTNKSLMPKIKVEPLIYQLNLDKQIKSETTDEAILSWMDKVASGEFVLTEKTLITLDHSNAISTRVLHKLLKLITKSKSKLVLFGYKNSYAGDYSRFSPTGEK